jgi:hypothetical protein
LDVAVSDASVDNDSELMTGVNGIISIADFEASEHMIDCAIEIESGNSLVLYRGEVADMMKLTPTGIAVS